MHMNETQSRIEMVHPSMSAFHKGGRGSSSRRFVHHTISCTQQGGGIHDSSALSTERQCLFASFFFLQTTKPKCNCFFHPWIRKGNILCAVELWKLTHLFASPVKLSKKAISLRCGSNIAKQIRAVETKTSRECSCAAAARHYGNVIEREIMSRWRMQLR